MRGKCGRINKVSTPAHNGNGGSRYPFHADAEDQHGRKAVPAYASQISFSGEIPCLIPCILTFYSLVSHAWLTDKQESRRTVVGEGGQRRQRLCDRQSDCASRKHEEEYECVGPIGSMALSAIKNGEL